MKHAVFIDKDGTLIPDIPYNVDPGFIELEQNLIEGLKRLQEAGYLLIVVSNQSGVALGHFREKELEKVKQKLHELLVLKEIDLHGFYYCPHLKDAPIEKYRIACDCRKPEPGMLIKAASELGVDLAGSWMIGDILNDAEAGNRAGCRSVLINNGNETEWILTEDRIPAYIAGTINEAADFILRQTDGRHG